MPKLKTRKGIAKRIRVTANGKLMRAHAWKSHMLEHKKQKNKRAYKQLQAVSPRDAKQVRRALGI
ncbi:MAG: 50S ribosomal protein L35 [Chloroflexi bacterium]|nr:MAG: 50S ribosomal protein L35 [Chloroflexota bacterium]